MRALKPHNNTSRLIKLGNLRSNVSKRRDHNQKTIKIAVVVVARTLGSWFEQTKFKSSRFSSLPSPDAAREHRLVYTFRVGKSEFSQDIAKSFSHSGIERWELRTIESVLHAYAQWASILRNCKYLIDRSQSYFLLGRDAWVPHRGRIYTQRTGSLGASTIILEGSCHGREYVGH